MLILGAVLLIGMVAGCPLDSSNVGSFDAGKMVLSFYKAINDGDTAKAQSYVSAGDRSTLQCIEDLVGVMAGKIQKVEVLDIFRSEGMWGGSPFIEVSVRITCDPGVPTRVRSSLYGGNCRNGTTCGDRKVFLLKFDSGWRIYDL